MVKAHKNILTNSKNEKKLRVLLPATPTTIGCEIMAFKRRMIRKTFKIKNDIPMVMGTSIKVC